MKITFRDKFGWPIETIKGRWVQNTIRRVIHTRSITFTDKALRFEIVDTAINDLQRDSINKMIARAKAAHYTNIYMRINGKDEHFEADWLKHLRVS